MGTSRRSDFTPTVEQRLRRALCAFALSVPILLLMVSSALAAPEAPLTEAATGVTATEATLHGQPNPNTQAIVGYEFHFNNNGSCEGSTVGGVQPALRPAGSEVETPVTGLEPNKDYMVCLLVTNELGETTTGNEVSFKTLPQAPVIDSEAASAVGSTAATLEAQVNPNNESSSFLFEYSTEVSGETLEGAVTELAGAEPLAAEFGDRLATVPRVEGLAPATTYFYRVVAENATGPSDGPVQSFTTPPAPFTDAVESVTASSATLNGHFTLTEAAPTQYSFAYRRGEVCAGEFTTPFEEAGTGTGEAKETASISGLQPFSRYTACFDTANASGTQQGNEVSFQTLALPPAIDAQSSSAVKDTSAALESQINPNNQATSFAFEVSTEGEVGGSLTGAIQSLPGEASFTGFGDQPAKVTAKGLEPRTTYFYRVKAENEQSKTEGTPAQGTVQSFTTLATPLVSAEPATEVTRTQATLSGSVNPGGEPTTFHYVYVEAGKYNPGAGECPEGGACAYRAGNTTHIEQAGSGYQAHPAGPVQISELKPGTTYDYALVASNSLGTAVTANQQLTTLPATAPTVTTGAVTGVSQLSATITGSVDTRGLPTTLSLQFGATPGSAPLIPATAGGESGTTVAISLSFPADLQPGTTYYYRAVATNVDGTAEGAILSFTTATFPTPAGFTLSPGLPLIPFQSIAELQAREAREHGAAATPSQAHGRAQKLKKALKACRRIKSKHRRTRCERQAHWSYQIKKARKQDAPVPSRRG